MRLILVTGLDGCGKTTQVQKLFEDQRVASGWSYVWGRWEPRLTGLLMDLWRRRKAGLEAGQRPTEDRGHADFVAKKQQLFESAWKRRLWMTLVLLEYLPQLWLRLLPAILRGRGVLCDRAHPDLWVDLTVNFGGDASLLAEISRHPLCRLLPRVDRLVLLKVDPEVGYRRKMDGTPLAYLQAREPLYEALTALLPARSVDADGPLETVQERLCEAVGDLLQFS